jgi:hypothetical protein
MEFNQTTADALDLISGAQRLMNLIYDLCKTWAKIRPAMVTVLPANITAIVDSVADVVCPFAEIYRKVYPQ